MRVQALTRLLKHETELASLLGRSPSHAELGSFAGMDVAEVRSTLQAGRDARTQLVEANMRLVFSMAAKYSRKTGVPLEDLAQEGNVGLVRAVQKYDPSRGYRFATYAWYWVQNAIIMAALNMKSNLRLSSYMHAELARLNDAWSKIDLKRGRAPRDDELAEELKVPVERVHWLGRVRNGAYKLASLDNAVQRGGAAKGSAASGTPAASKSRSRATSSPGNTYVDALPSTAASPDDKLLARNGKEVALGLIERAFASLTLRERQVITLRFGLPCELLEVQGVIRCDDREEGRTKLSADILSERAAGWTPMGADGKPSLRQVGEDLGISTFRVQQIEANALTKLRMTPQTVLNDLKFVYEEYLEDGRGVRGEDWDC